ncbi:dTDP-4-dehydrorhamnose reductase [Rhizobium lemnae]|uniref:dTDP-4-dehydrorhamnose reductase n=1 Tax=Rhizobium lemnae TaxID=1214924 RepID=A0ABV8EDX2_9HYPH|nr:dTDP-4-dehydrorhamnose reductase [Rhizobium lemnae]MCJ8510587.1 dTDP-4-dehydrorhamnose reductase [Rhizobium lemnae]
MKSRILVTGVNGQVVTALREAATDRPDVELIWLGRPDFDLSDTENITDKIVAAAPHVILSVAAYTAVDNAESDESTATSINAVAVGEIAEGAARLSIPVIHLSTDYVFDGTKPSPYLETDKPNPTSAYGRSKLAGEQVLAARLQNHIILRTAWVYSPFGKNFLKTMLSLAETRDHLRVVSDQRGNPTSAIDIAEALLVIAGNLLTDKDPGLRGTFHMSGTGEATWAEFAEQIFQASERLGGPTAQVEHIPSSQYPTPAKRPANSRLDCGKLEQVHGVRLPDWRSSTELVVRRLMRQSSN